MRICICIYIYYPSSFSLDYILHTFTISARGLWCLITQSTLQLAMAPKKKAIPQRDHALGQAATAKLVQDANVNSTDVGMPCVNAEYYSYLEKRTAIMLSHPLFSTLSTAAPLSIDAKEDPLECGWKEPYKASLFKVSWEQNQRHECGGNLLWINMFWSPAPDVPLNAEARIFRMSIMLLFCFL